MRRTYLLFILSLLIFLFNCEDNITNSEDESDNQVIENKLYAYFDSLQVNTPIPGIVAGVWSPNKNIEWVQSFGYSNLEEGIPMSSNLKFRIASNTKTMTNTILLQLCDEDKIDLSDTLSQYLPNFRKSDSVTIQMLTDMTSGIREYMESPKINEWLSKDPGIYFPLDSLISFAANLEYYFPPGDGWHYSNTNTIIIQKIIQMITGNSLKQEMKTRLFEPIGLNKTEYLSSGVNIPIPHSQGYYSGDTTDKPLNLTEVYNISLTHGAGAAVSTIYELKTYVEHLVNGEYLSEKMHEHRLNHLVEPSKIPLPLKYGTGWMEWEDFYGHDGGFPGFTSLMVSNPATKTTVIFWFNCQLYDYSVLDSFAEVYNILYDEQKIEPSKYHFKLPNFRLENLQYQMNQSFNKNKF